MKRNSKTYNQLFIHLSSLFPKLDTELSYETPFQLLVAVMLSAQSTDKQVNKITDQLFLTIKTPYDILQLGQEKLEQAIKSINYYRMKAKHIYRTSSSLTKGGAQRAESSNRRKLTSNEQKIFNTYGYIIPEDEHELMQFPGVGEKTAKVIQSVLYKKPVIAVDTHVHRVANRLGIVHTKTPLQTSKAIETKIPKKRKPIAHHALILFGRYHCKALKPRCEKCGLKGSCKVWNKKINS